MSRTPTGKSVITHNAPAGPRWDITKLRTPSSRRTPLVALDLECQHCSRRCNHEWDADPYLAAPERVTSPGADLSLVADNQMTAHGHSYTTRAPVKQYTRSGSSSSAASSTASLLLACA